MGYPRSSWVVLSSAISYMPFPVDGFCHSQIEVSIPLNLLSDGTESPDFDTISLLGEEKLDDSSDEEVIWNASNRGCRVRTKEELTYRYISKISSFFSGEDTESYTTAKAIAQLLDNKVHAFYQTHRTQDKLNFDLCGNWTLIPICPKPAIDYMTQMYTDARCVATFADASAFSQKYLYPPNYCNVTPPYPSSGECSRLFIFRNDTFAEQFPDYYRKAFCSEIKAFELAKGEQGFYKHPQPTELNHGAVAVCIGLNALTFIATCKDSLPALCQSGCKKELILLIKIIAQSALLLAPVVSLSMPPLGYSISATTMTSNFLGASGSGLNSIVTSCDLYRAISAIKKIKTTSTSRNGGSKNNQLVEIVRQTMKLTMNGTQCALQLADVAGSLSVQTKAALYIACFSVNTLQLAAKGMTFCGSQVTPFIRGCVDELNIKLTHLSSRTSAMPRFMQGPAMGFRHLRNSDFFN